MILSSELRLLATQVNGREELSVEAIYRAHVADVSRWAARLGGPGLELEDVVQEVFELVQRELPRFRGEARLSTWLYRITENVVRHHRRSVQYRNRSHYRAQPLVSLEPTSLERLESREAIRLVYRALDEMSERYRTAIILFEIEDLSGEEVAERMGLKLANLWVVLHRARAELVRRLMAIATR